ncbi:hypothetical protein JDM601_3823 [Mycolicibacter sinensis]|uniref:Uncharacterized protein n=1 Tax=Mycolicibacter sinensis (strain JDM601) TaxID=875328 RepID=F5YRN2_MYCSD|nr:hypothetical protein [Mycolicibacter sinensis]AEF37823.1 hypothetical protein JDM601_3823 [Mycolicibacter sinensis]
MTATAEYATTGPDGTRLSPGLWLTAVVELGVAVAVGAVLLRGNADTAVLHHPQMPDVHHGPVQPHWTAGFFVSAAVAAALMLGWTIVRRRALALGAAGGLIAVVAAEPVRTLALQSHLIAMVILEVVLVAAPLLIVSGVRGRTDQRTRRSSAWMAGVIAAVLANSAFLIVLHVPAIHGRAAALTAVPGWLIMAAVVTGVGYWSAILLTTGRAPLALRRAALTIGQEVAAILGLAALIVPATHTHQVNPLGLSAATDQRLGGALMLITCAAVTLPLIKHLAK